MKSGDKTNPHWAMTAAGKFHRLLLVDPDKLGLSGVSGVAVLWSGGLRPQWLYVDKSRDLGLDLDSYLDNDEIMEYNDRGGVFVSWALIRPEYQDGVLKYLLQTMTPQVDHPNPPGNSVKALAVLAPGDVVKA